MPRAECYYDILGVDQTATSDEIKKAYRNLALTWHPDKNQANKEEAHTKFQSILKAYETLSDGRERDWYDRHKDQILSDGKDGEGENLLNLFQYFSSSCYTNFDDSDEGFYTVYRKVFETIAKEEEQAKKLASKMKKKGNTDDEDFPNFGNSESSYDDVVRRFYAYWSGFCTSMNFDQLDKYKTTEAENRRILRAMEKENRKLKEVAKKERNTNIRNLVEFVKKRDRRLKAQKLLVESQIQANRRKTAEKQRLQRERLLKESSEYKPTAFDNMDDIEEQLRQLEEEYDEDLDYKRRRNDRIQESCSEDEDDNADNSCDFDQDEGHDSNPKLGESDKMLADTDDSDDNESNEEDEDVSEEEEPDLFCAACKKEFKPLNAYKNHLSSKKHKKNVIKLTKLLEEKENGDTKKT